METKPIQKLEQEVINRIAAGEVIQRPSNALKELIENSLDAKASSIQITVKNGGLKLLQIQDNGTGIRKEDFNIVCERFTTSKLSAFEDLQKISTYGFRGEALASISHVAHLTITSKTRKDICAYKAEYCDSKLKSPPKPLAGNQGTIIAVEDLFYNMSVRRNALRSPAEEYQKISDVVSKYAIHNASVGFALKKQGGNNDIRTPVKSNHIDNIKLIYGNSIGRELIEFSLENSDLQFKCQGYITSVNYSNKKFQFLLFINHRLVDNQSLKKCIDTVYQTYLPKNSHPFVYLSLELDPNNIDVNVHPTKHEVHFLNESQIVEIITNNLEQKLLGSNTSRVFYTQSKLPNIQFDTKETLRDKELNKNKTMEAPKYVVRTDSNIQKLDKFFEVSSKKPETEPSEVAKGKQALNFSLTEDEYQEHHQQFLQNQDDFENNCLDKDTGKDDTKIDVEDSAHKSTSVNNQTKHIEELETAMTKHTKLSSPVRNSKDTSNSNPEAKKNGQSINKHLIKRKTRVETNLTSVLQLRKAVEENCHKVLRETFAQHVFVGPINTKRALIQHNTQLLLCNTKAVLEELFYQFILYNFQNFDCYTFPGGMPIKQLALLGLDLPETGWTEEDGPKDELANRINEILTEKSPMLNEYFSLNIDSGGMLTSLPILLDKYIPDAVSLPMYIIRLATEVNWEEEKTCFDTVARETAIFYSNVSESEDENGKSWKWVTEYVLYPAIKNYLIPPKGFSENAAVLEITSLPNLYKVFERC